jgi:predicted TIM-barrel fold metal-dependent hydrolase
MDALMIVSTDCHAGLPTERYRDYLPSQFHPLLDEYLENRRVAREHFQTIGAQKNGFAIFSQQFVDDFKHEPLVEEGGPVGGWEFDKRTKELEADGIVGEVIDPGPVNPFIETSIPFQGRAFFGDRFTADHSLDAMWAGARAYNRWLSEVGDPSHQAMLALLPSLLDVDEVRREIEWAASAGFRGVIVRQAEEGLPLLADLRYEPLWSALEDAGLPAHFHGGVGVPAEPPIESPAAHLFGGIETAYWGYRPIWYLIMGGTFERHPRLDVVFTEVHASWVPSVIDMLDVRYEDQWLMFRDFLPRKPSEYWYEHGHVGASFLSRQEVELRDVIGVNNMMYGNDYPHVEGIWPQSRRYMNEIFGGVPEADVRKLAGENAARLYGFDLATLNARAETVGPAIADVINSRPASPDTFATDRMTSRAARPASWVMAGVPRGFVREALRRVTRRASLTARCVSR